MTSPFVYMPLRLVPPLSDPLSAVGVVPGVSLHAIVDKDVTSGRFGTIPALPFAANTLLRVDPDAYESGAQSRLQPKGVYQPNPVVPDDGIFVSAAATVRWILTALILNSPFQFEFGPHYRTRRDPSTNREDTVSSGSRELQSTRFLPPQRMAGHVDITSLTDVAIRIEEYFRHAPFRMDRIAVALWTYWTAACAMYPEQTFLGLCTVLESILSTNEQEVTHQLAERAAVVARKRGADGIGVYKGIKRLYGIRSNIVHGRGATKDDLRYVKKRQRAKAPVVAANVDLLLHPMARIVPMQDLQELWAVTAELLRTMLLIDGIYDALRSGDDQLLDAIFLSALVGTHHERKQEPSSDSTEGSNK